MRRDVVLPAGEDGGLKGFPLVQGHDGGLQLVFGQVVVGVLKVERHQSVFGVGDDVAQAESDMVGILPVNPHGEIRNVVCVPQPHELGHTKLLSPHGTLGTRGLDLIVGGLNARDVEWRLLRDGGVSVRLKGHSVAEALNAWIVHCF
jgi:hypothetical protein